MSSAKPHASAPSKTSQKGIWIASYPESGNTRVRIFIHNLFRELGGGDDAQDINALGEHTAWELSAPLFETHLGKPASDAIRAEIAKARYDVHTELAQRHSRPFFHQGPQLRRQRRRLSDRQPRYYACRDLHYPKSSRHCDFLCASLRPFGRCDYRSYGQRARAQRRHPFSGTWSFHVASWMSVPSSPVHVIRYEDMLNTPERVFAGIAAFLRLKPSPDQLKNAVANSSFAVLADQATERSFIERPEKSKKFFRQGEAGQWRRVLQPLQIRRIIGDHAPMMQRCSYLLPNCGRPISSDLGPSDFTAC